jgi:hypothetical protein
MRQSATNLRQQSTTTTKNKPSMTQKNASRTLAEAYDFCRDAVSPAIQTTHFQNFQLT